MSIDLKSFEEYKGSKSPLPTIKVGKTRSILSSPVKGFIEETGREIRNVGGFIEKILGISPEESTVVPEEIAEVKIEELLPTQEGAFERGLERAGRYAPYAFLGGGNPLTKLLSSTLAAGAGQSIEEFGGSPLLQAIGEVTTQGLTGLAKKGLGIPFNYQKREIQNLAKQLGLTEQEITPLLQSKFKQQTIGKIAEKGKVGEKLQETRQGLNRVYGDLAQGGIAKQQVPQNVIESVDNKIIRLYFDLPIKAQQAIDPAINRYLNSSKTGQDLINFYGDINSLYPYEKTPQIFKNPIKKGLSAISKPLSNDFELVNNLFSKYYKISQRLAPGLESELLRAGEAGKLAYDVVSGNLSGLQKTLGIIGGRQLGSQLLTNPRLQNLSSKFVSALNQNKPIVARNMFEKIIANISQKNPELGKELKKIDLSQFEDIQSG